MSSCAAKIDLTGVGKPEMMVGLLCLAAVVSVSLPVGNKSAVTGGHLEKYIHQALLILDFLRMHCNDLSH